MSNLTSCLEPEPPLISSRGGGAANWRAPDYEQAEGRELSANDLHLRGLELIRAGPWRPKTRRAARSTQRTPPVWRPRRAIILNPN